MALWLLDAVLFGTGSGNVSGTTVSILINAIAAGLVVAAAFVPVSLTMTIPGNVSVFLTARWLSLHKNTH